ncbi:MAG TPA: CpsB/CapC family capsule biosynthesis tyrosine phosphatase [Terriglobales bacterium]|nr:CpsB/CapC family capsule biosynthesis tyrosine phosphatase [Terriglobales bacterium]
MVDIHCHIIPEVDDGASSWDMAVEMCEMAVHDGIEHIVATPHADFKFPYHREELAARLDRLQQLTGGAPRLTLGCDFHLSYDNLEDAFAHPGRYTIGETGYLLVEFSDYSIPQQITGALLRLIEMGITPVITHPERNPLLQHNLDRLLEWVDDGCLVQVTANSLTGFWGEQARRSARSLLEQQLVHVLATDAHDLRRRVPILSAARDAVALWHGEERARTLVVDNPRAIVSGEKIRATSARAGK